MPSLQDIKFVLFWSGSIFLLLGVIAAGTLVWHMVTLVRKDRATVAVNLAALATEDAKAVAAALKALAEFLKELADVIRALSAAPVWLALTFTGATLILLGRWAV